jgi:hypothetical protein
MAKSGSDRKTQVSFTDDLKRKFLHELKRTCNVTKASQKINISRITAYSAKEANPEFAAAWENALQEGVDLLEEKARQRAFGGIERNVYYQGKVVGKQKEYSDGLTMFLLKAHRPEKYRDNQDIKLKHSGGVLVVPSGSNGIEGWMKENAVSMEHSADGDNSE